MLFSTMFAAALLSGLMGGGLKASEINKIVKDSGWTWDCTDVNVLNKTLDAVNGFNATETKAQVKKIGIILRTKAQIVLIGKNSTNTSYAELKQIIDKVLADAGYKRTTSKSEATSYKEDPGLKSVVNSIIPQIVLKTKNFNSYKLLLIKDSEFSHVSYRRTQALAALKNENINEFRAEFKLYIKQHSRGTTNVYAERVTQGLELYKDRMTEIEKSDILKDLQYVKILTYSNIQKNDAWKKPMVTLELMIKSAQ